MQANTRGFALHVGPALAYLVAIFVGGSLPQGPDLGLDFAFKDKVLHLVAFAGFEVLAWRALRYLRPEWGVGWLLVGSCALAIAAGALLEIWQAVLPTRQAELLDWVADSLGALLAAAALWRVAKARQPGRAVAE